MSKQSQYTIHIGDIADRLYSIENIINTLTISNHSNDALVAERLKQFNELLSAMFTATTQLELALKKRDVK